MDFKKFGGFVLFVGILVLGYGLTRWTAIPPRGSIEFDRHQEIAASEQSIAIKISIGGGVAALIGLGMFISAKEA